ncbi:MAG: hypothetical protein KDK51_07420 [Deltaproteobacteria bacterium]|nr:hypothetical protein [Deltaproteobacteria bacterium]
MQCDAVEQGQEMLALRCEDNLSDYGFRFNTKQNNVPWLGVSTFTLECRLTYKKSQNHDVLYPELIVVMDRLVSQEKFKWNANLPELGISALSDDENILIHCAVQANKKGIRMTKVPADQFYQQNMKTVQSDESEAQNCTISNIVELSSYAQKANNGSEIAKSCITGFLEPLGGIVDLGQTAKKWAEQGDLLMSYGRWEALLRARAIGNLRYFLESYIDKRVALFAYRAEIFPCATYWYRYDCVQGKKIPEPSEAWMDKQLMHAIEIDKYGASPFLQDGVYHFDVKAGAKLDQALQSTKAPLTFKQDHCYIMNLGAGGGHENPFLMSTMHFYGNEKRVYVQNLDDAYYERNEMVWGGDYEYRMDDLNTIEYSRDHGYQNQFHKLSAKWLFDRVDNIQKNREVTNRDKEALQNIYPVQDVVVMRDPLFSGPSFGVGLSTVLSYMGGYQHLKDQEGLFYVLFDDAEKAEHDEAAWILTEVLRLDIDSSSENHILAWKGKPKQN